MSPSRLCAPLLCHVSLVAAHPHTLAALQPFQCIINLRLQPAHCLYLALSPPTPPPCLSSALRTTNLETLEGYTQEKSKELSAETLKELQVGARRGCEAG